jgi:hypothetical protein
MATVLFTDFKKLLFSVRKLPIANANSSFDPRFIYIQLHCRPCPLFVKVVANHHDLQGSC